MSRLIQAAHSVPGGTCAGAEAAFPGWDALVELDELWVHADIIQTAASASKQARANSNARDCIRSPTDAYTIGIVRVELGSHTLMDLRRRPEFRKRATLGRPQIASRQSAGGDYDPLEVEPRIDHPDFDRVRACLCDLNGGVLDVCVVGDPLRP